MGLEFPSRKLPEGQYVLLTRCLDDGRPPVLATNGSNCSPAHGKG